MNTGRVPKLLWPTKDLIMASSLELLVYCRSAYFHCKQLCLHVVLIQVARRCVASRFLFWWSGTRHINGGVPVSKSRHLIVNKTIIQKSNTIKFQDIFALYLYCTSQPWFFVTAKESELQTYILIRTDFCSSFILFTLNNLTSSFYILSFVSLILLLSIAVN